MKYDFTTLVDRSSLNSSKWDGMLSKGRDLPKGIVPFSVADMEFKSPSKITEGLRDYLTDSVLGYVHPSEAYYDAICNWMKKHHGYEVDRNRIVTTPGVVCAINLAIECFTRPDESIMIMAPSYPPFYHTVEDCQRKLVVNNLILKDGHYEIDFEDFEAKAKDPKTTMFILCSPHNPTGRVWKKEELQKIAQICLENHVFVVADEIHHDLIMPGYTHTCFPTLSKEIEDNCMMCTSVSKTFNVAGMKVSNIIIPNEERFAKFQKLAKKWHVTSLGLLSFEACRIGYTECEDWLEELICVIDENKHFVEEYLKENLPMLKAVECEGTYLMWIDFRALNMNNEELEEFMEGKAYWYTNQGYTFLENGSGFERLNIACPKWVLKEALDRLNKAVHER